MEPRASSTAAASGEFDASVPDARLRGTRAGVVAVLVCITGLASATLISGSDSQGRRDAAASRAESSAEALPVHREDIPSPIRSRAATVGDSEVSTSPAPAGPSPIPVPTGAVFLPPSSPGELPPGHRRGAPFSTEPPAPGHYDFLEFRSTVAYIVMLDEYRHKVRVAGLREISALSDLRDSQRRQCLAALEEVFGLSPIALWRRDHRDLFYKPAQVQVVATYRELRARDSRGYHPAMVLGAAAEDAAPVLVRRGLARVATTPLLATRACREYLAELRVIEKEARTASVGLWAAERESR
jgi:hypothetical protein